MKKYRFLLAIIIALTMALSACSVWFTDDNSIVKNSPVWNACTSCKTENPVVCISGICQYSENMICTDKTGKIISGSGADGEMPQNEYFEAINAFHK